MNNMRLAIIILAGLFISVFFMGCASMQVSVVPKTKLIYADKINPEELWPDDMLKNEFERYWVYRYNGNSDAAFEMEAPHFRELAPKEFYKQYVGRYGMNNDLIEIKIFDLIRESESFIQIRGIAMTRKFPGKQEETHLLDRWVRVRGTWYHVIHDPIMFPDMS